MKFRVRQWGDAEWTEIKIEGELAHYLAGAIGSAINSKHLHVQIQVDGEWENL